jgi:hypothetical protein
MPSRFSANTDGFISDAAVQAESRLDPVNLLSALPQNSPHDRFLLGRGSVK